MSWPKRSSLMHIYTGHDGFFAQRRHFAKCLLAEPVTRDSMLCEAVPSVTQPTPQLHFSPGAASGQSLQDRPPRRRSGGPLVGRP